MKTFFPRESSFTRFLRSLFIALVLVPAFWVAADPTWWPKDTSQTKPGMVVNDYRPVMAGQAKNMAYQAMLAMDAALQPFGLPGGGAGDEVRQMVDSWKNTSGGWIKAENNQILNQGQLKAIAKPFYDRLAQLRLWPKGYIFSTADLQTFNTPQRVQIAALLPTTQEQEQWTNTARYPWKFWVAGSFWAQNNRYGLFLQPASVGQLKHVFNFDPVTLLTSTTYSVNGQSFTFLNGAQPRDTDGDGTSDLLEYVLGFDPGSSTSKPGQVNPYAADSQVSTGISEAAASRFLMQATWGPTWESIAYLRTKGFSDWIDEQKNETHATYGFRPNNERVQMIPWRDGQGSMRWSNIWHEWDTSSSQDTPITQRLFPNSETDSAFYARLDNSWKMTAVINGSSVTRSYADYDGPATANTNSSNYPGYASAEPVTSRTRSWQQVRDASEGDPNERGPYKDAAFPKRGTEPYMFYLHWRKMVLDRPLWQAAVNNGWMVNDNVEGANRVLPWPYEVGGVKTNDAAWTAVQAVAGMDDAWLHRGLYDSDQLRQRVAWALSQILVVSDFNYFASQVAGVGYPAPAHFYDMLNDHAFRNYKDLLTAVTFHPLMGAWLTYTGSVGAQDVNDTALHPDENYAREIMQLFSMGLHELRDDATPRLDNAGNRLFTYNQEDVRQLARVFTGFNKRGNQPADVLPMFMNAAGHDVRAKTFLGKSCPAVPGGHTAASAEAEVRDSVAWIATRPSVAPYICRQLIQHLTCSNPSPAYVRRVVAVWRTNESAGDQLGKVVKAILLDLEARAEGTALTSASMGHLRDPIVRLLGAMRAFNAGRDYSLGRFDLTQSTQHPLDAPAWGGNHFLSDGTHLYQDLQQYPFMSPSVFSFYAPGFAPAGDLFNARLLGPEYQVVTSATTASSIGRLWRDMDFRTPTSLATATANGVPAIPGSGAPLKQGELVLNMLGSNGLVQYLQEPGGTLVIGRANGEPEGFDTYRYPDTQKEIRLRRWYRPPFTVPGSSLNLTGKALRLRFNTASGFQGTELILSSPERNSTAGATSAQADAFLDKLNILLCAGRMSGPTRQALQTLLTSSTTAADNAILMNPADTHRRERAAVEMLLMLPEAVVIR